MRKVIWAVFLAVVVVFSVLIVWDFLLVDENNELLVDSASDVFFSIGEGDAGMIDFIRGNLTVNEGELVLEFSTRESLGYLSKDEVVEFEGLLILCNEEEEVKSFEFLVGADFSGVEGYVTDIGSGLEVDQEVFVDQNVFGVVFDVAGVEFSLVEWSLFSSYERFSGDELVVFASDFAPDDDMFTTFLGGDES